MAQLIHEHQMHLRTPEGLGYVARTYAAPNDDGMWEAWLRFHPTDGDGPGLETDRETSQSSRAAVEGWALGLEGAYLQGAFARAHLIRSS